jgi:hypothetical protein
MTARRRFKKLDGLIAVPVVAAVVLQMAVLRPKTADKSE